MKQLYSAPEVCVITFSEDAIRTSTISQGTDNLDAYIWSEGGIS